MVLPNLLVAIWRIGPCENLIGVQSRTQAALHAVRTGLVSTEELGEESW
jgi:hypothetical protein